MPAGKVVGEAVVIYVVMIFIRADDVANGIEALAVIFFQFGAAGPKSGCIKNHFHAVIAHESIIAGGAPILDNGVSDVG